MWVLETKSGSSSSDLNHQAVSKDLYLVFVNMQRIIIFFSIKLLFWIGESHEIMAYLEV